MGRHNGVWSPVHGQIWDHHRTRKACEWMRTNVRRSSEATAPFLVVGWLNRLNCWCLQNAENGSLQGLSEARIGTLAWPEAIEAGTSARAVGEAVLGALRAGGFIEGTTIRQFDEFHARILKERRRKRDEHNREDGITPESAEPSAYHSAEHSAPHSAEHSADRSAHPSAATGTGTGTGTGNTPLSPPTGGRLDLRFRSPRHRTPIDPATLAAQARALPPRPGNPPTVTE